MDLPAARPLRRRRARHSRYFSEDAFKAAAEPKEFHVVPDAGHVDLYDRTDKIAFDTLDEFFAKNLA